MIVLASGSPAARPVTSDLPARHRVAAPDALRGYVSHAEAGAEVDLADHLRVLCGVEQRATPAAASIAIYTDLRCVTVWAETAILIDLAFQELLRNALLHAYPPGDAGHVGVHLWPVSTVPDVRAFLLIADGGQGFADEPPATSDRGIPLARHLIQRCSGTLAREPGPGTIWRIALPQKAGPSQAATAGELRDASIRRGRLQARRF